jgi:urea carboxylase
MEGPGGYQLVGRTAQIWNTHRSTAEFAPGKPWLLRFFDQVRFYPVSEKELLDFRQAFLHGRAHLDITEETFSIPKYKKFLEDNQEDIAKFRRKQQKAFAEERDRWIADGTNNFVVTESAEAATDELVAPKNGQLVASPITGNVWAVLAKEGERVTSGQKIMVIEAMKMEVGVEAPMAGIVKKIGVAPGKMVSAGQSLAIIEEIP